MESPSRVELSEWPSNQKPEGSEEIKSNAHLTSVHICACMCARSYVEPPYCNNVFQVFYTYAFWCVSCQMYVKELYMEAEYHIKQDIVYPMYVFAVLWQIVWQ